jgi:hypothetical protein
MTMGPNPTVSAPMKLEILYDERATTTFFRLIANGKDYAALRGSGDPLDVQVEATINKIVRHLGYTYISLAEVQRFAPFRQIDGDPVEQMREAFSRQSINGRKLKVIVRGGRMPVEEPMVAVEEQPAFGIAA